MNKVSKEQIAQWKAQYGNVYRITVADKVAYLKSPDRKTMSYASSVIAKDPIKFNEILLKQCWIDGDAEIQTDDALFLGVSAQLAEIIEIAEAKLEKL